jgi:primosomal protein N' (replication factor Y)
MPTVYEAKDIVCLLDNAPILRRPQMKFWEWIASYYQAFLGDVYQAAVPAGLKLESETRVCINPDYEAETVLSEKEEKVLMALSDGKPTTVLELNKVTEIRDVMPTLKGLLDKGAVEISEELTDKFRVKNDTFVRMSAEAMQEDNLRKIFDDLGRAKKQLDVLMMYIDLSKCLIPTKRREVSRKELMEKSGASAAVLSGRVGNLPERNRTIGCFGCADFCCLPAQ